MRQSRNCSFVQKLNVNEASKTIQFEEFTINFNSRSTSIISSFDNQSKNEMTQTLMNYFNEIDYFVKKIAVIKTKKIAVELKIVDVAVNFKSRSKIKFNKFFKSFKSDEFTINFSFNSTSIKSIFESIIKLNVVLVVNFKSRAKINFKSFKSDKFTINFSSNSISIKSKLEDVFLIANSNSISTSIAKQIVIEAIKSEIINFKNINFFDFTMQVNF